MSSLRGTLDYDYIEHFNTFAFSPVREGFFCELELDAKGALLKGGENSIAKICLSPCRVTDPFMTKERAIDRIPKDKRFVIVTFDKYKEFDGRVLVTLKVYKVWVDKITKETIQEKDLMVEFTTFSDHKGELFKVEKLISMGEEEYGRYYRLYTTCFLSNLIAYAAKELFCESTGGSKRFAQWTKTINPSALEATIKRLKREYPNLITSREELRASIAKNREEQAAERDVEELQEEEAKKPPSIPSRRRKELTVKVVYEEDKGTGTRSRKLVYEENFVDVDKNDECVIL